MLQTQELRIRGKFTGYRRDAIFRLSNGQVWRQRRYKYKYKYSYRPMAKLSIDGGRAFLEINGMEEPIEVVRVSLVEDGPIVSDFHGFNGGATFEFQNGHIWKQAEYKYVYHYAYRPEALVVDGPHGTILYVDGMSDTVPVRRV